MQPEDIYQPGFTVALFNNMARTYGFTNLMASFGFSHRWRKQCVQLLPAESVSTGYDLMSGMCELAETLKPRLHAGCQLVAIDLSDIMLKKAKDVLPRYQFEITLQQADILKEPAGSPADFVISSFGLKTFNQQQQRELAAKTAALLKPGGAFSFVEISTPRNILLKPFYMFYLRFVIPVIGWLCKGNASDYRMLGIYTRNFRNCRFFARCLEEENLEVHYKPLFFGCASAVYGVKPAGRKRVRKEKSR